MQAALAPEILQRMTLERYFRLSSYTLVTTSFLMLVATRQLDWPSILLFSGVLLFGWQVDAGRIKWKLPTTLVSVLMLVFLPFPFIDWLVLQTSPIVALIHFIFFASAMKLLQAKRSRDWLWLYVVAFFQMLLAAGMMIDTTFFVLLVVFLFSAISTLVSFEMQRAQQALQEAQPPQEVGELEFWRETPTLRKTLLPPRWRSVTLFAAFSLLVILFLATPLFLAMPRLALRQSGTGWMQGASLSGFSDTVRLGDVGQLKLNPKLVMRVRVNQPPSQYGSNLRWRGVTLDFYDGSSWRDSLSVQRNRRLGARPVSKRGNTYWVDEAASARRAEQLTSITRQTFYLEPLDTPTIFAAPKPLWIEGPPSLWRDESDGLWTSNHALNRLVYQVESDTRQPSDKELRERHSTDYPVDIHVRYTQLPRSFDARVGQLAANVAQGATTTIDIARRIESHLRTSYSYSLNLKRTNDGEPVADFLFNVRAGHCEYFASAMTLMLRTQGIPARLVNGFQMGEYSEISDFYTVRQSDAHSWVEVYFPQHGWLAFDPTPAAGLSQYENNWLATLRHFSESVEMFWLENVIGFSANEQASMAFRVQRMVSDSQSEFSTQVAEWKLSLLSRLRALREGVPARSTSEWAGEILTHPLMLTLFACGLLLGGFLYYRKRANSWRRRIQQEPITSAIAFYQEMLDALARAGHHRLPEQTPQEFAAHVGLAGVQEITMLYQQVRFGGRRLNEAEIARVEAALKELDQGLG
jgi:transglutaminase-like putative cysteine protease